jgi:hypothetical protein
MKFTVNKKNNGLIFFLLSIFMFFSLLIIVFVNKLPLINKYLFKNFDYFVTNRTIYSNYFHHNNYEIYENKSLVILKPLNQKINKFSQIQMANGLIGWVKSEKLHRSYKILIYNTIEINGIQPQIIKILSIKEKNQEINDTRNKFIMINEKKKNLKFKDFKNSE